MKTKIPVFEPIIGEEEIANVTEALRRGEISGSFGTFIPEFEKTFSKFCDCKYGIAVSNGTTALHLAVAAIGIQPGDEILVSASTNIASALAIYHNKGIPIPVDSEEGTWNMNLDLIEPLITSRTRAIIPVHLFGHPIDMDKLSFICKKHNLIIIEDCAESHGATCRGKMTGSFGDMGCFSFYANKIITTGEGGMIVTNNKELSDKLKLLRNLAFMQPRFQHKYAGYNFRMTGYQAAMGVAQVKKINDIIFHKRRVAQLYQTYLNGVKQIDLPVEKEYAKNVYWMYGVVLNDESTINRDTLIQKLESNGIETRTFFCPMNLQPCFADMFNERKVSDCPVAENLWKKGFYLPSAINLTEEKISFICDMIKESFL